MPTTTYLDNKLLEASLGNVAYSAVPYAALYSVSPTAAGGGTELSGSGYSRQSISMTVSAGSATSNAAVVFGNATADWSTAVAWAICDASSGGNVLYYAPFNPTQTVKSGKNLTVATGDITITIV